MEQLLPPETCRVVHRGLPPSQQPPPTDCRTARRQSAITGGEVVVGRREAGGAFRFSEWPDRWRREEDAREARDRERARWQRDLDWRDGNWDERRRRYDDEDW